jgi:glutathione S-transferase
MSIVPAVILESKWTPVVAIAATALCVVQIVASWRSTFVVSHKKVDNVPKRCDKEDGYKEKVVAYVFKSVTPTISGSPFSTKLATYLRFAGIPHVIKEAQFEKAPKNKVPYIEHAGNFFGDSQLIIRYLDNTYDVATMASAALRELGGLKRGFVAFDKLSAADQAICDVVRLTSETEIYWAIHSVKWAGKSGIGKKESMWTATRDAYFEHAPAVIRILLTPMIRVGALKDAWGYGLMRHSPEDQLYLACRAVRSLSTLLGDKAFFLGDFPAECDCSAFGALECCLDDSRWPNALTDYVRKECPNLVEYVARVRKMVFPDVAPSDPRPASRETGTPIKKK